MNRLKETLAQAACDEQLSPRDRRNQWLAAGWLVAWIFCAAFAPLLLRREIVPESMAWLVVTLPSLVGVPALIFFGRFVVQADELMRKIQMEALALGFGVGVAVSVTTELIGKAGGPVIDAGIVAAAMLVAYSIAVILGTRRYA